MVPKAAGPNGPPTLSHASTDNQARLTTLRLLRILAAAALLLPLLLFLFASWVSYRATQELAHERLTRSLEVMEEESLKAFQSMNLALDTIDELLANRPAAEVEADEARLRQRLLQIQRALPEVQSIWIFGPDGHPQIMTREYPARTSLDYSDQDYFLVPRDGPPGIYVGGIHQSISGGQPYFTFNRARRDAGGKFAGVIEMSLLPSDFTKFYSELASSGGMRFAMLREDGTILARYPLLVDDRRLEGRSGFLRALAASPKSAFYTTTALNDGIERLVGIRRVEGVPVYVSAGIATAEIRNEWMAAMALHLIFGLPATALLFGAVMVVLHRTRRLHAEQDRREAVELAMRHSQRMDAIGRLTGGVAHDFNNLLTIIIGNLEVALRQLESSTDGAQVRLSRRLGAAMQGAQRAATMTKRLLAFSRQQPLNPTPLDINRVLNGLSDFLRRALGEEISLEIVGSGGLWPIAADATELETALLNLAINARDAMGSGGKLTIEASNSCLDEAYCQSDPDLQPGQYVQIAVTDTGAGMTKEVLERAFEPFFTTKATGLGTGLGLSQMYGFVKQSGGHVKIYREIGEGTTVKIYLRRSAGTHVPPEGLKGETSRGRPGESILVVEDDGDVRAYVVETLSALGYDVREASGAEDALRSLEEHKAISLLLTDVVMPGMNGRQLADQARARRPELKVVFMTGYSRNAIVHQGRLDPDVELIQKPLSSEGIAETIRRVLDSAVPRTATAAPGVTFPPA